MRLRGHDILRLPTGIPGLGLVQIIGGNLQGGVQQIQYVADPLASIPKVYDAAVDTSYVSGLGNGSMILPDGSDGGKIIIRHNYSGLTDAVLAGRRYLLGDEITLTVTTGADTGKTFTAYTLLRG